MGEQDDTPHGRGVNRTGAGTERLRDEGARVRRAYAGYAASARKRRAWSAEAAGNRVLRAELAAALLGEAAAELAGPLPVLDVGCGTGWWLRRLEEEGVAPQRLHGVDVLRERVEGARAAAPGAHVEVADARALPYPDATFGLVTLLVTLSSLAGPGDLGAALREVARVTAPGGLVLVWEPRVPTPANRRTIRVTRAALRAGLGPELRTRTLTVLPPLARAVPRLYPVLARVPALRTHRLAAWRAPGAEAQSDSAA